MAEAALHPVPATLSLASVRVGERFRKNLGDLDSLRASVEAVGILQPLVVDTEGNLVAGLRRLRVAEALGWTEVPVRVVDLAGVGFLRAEMDENEEREGFTPSDLVAIHRALEERERAAARERQVATLNRGTEAPPSRERHVTLTETGKTSERVAALAGVSPRTYERARAVVDAAEKEPERLGPLVEEMDRTGNVHGAYEVLKGRRTLVSLRGGGEAEWHTPPEYLDLVREVLGEIDLDPASSEAANREVKAKRIYTAEEDGLHRPWEGKVFCFPPPGGAQAAFAAHLLEEYVEDRVREGVLLLEARAVLAPWFRKLWGHALCFTYKPIHFLSPRASERSLTRRCVFVYVGSSWMRFAEVFSPVGAVVRKVAP